MHAHTYTYRHSSIHTHIHTHTYRYRYNYENTKHLNYYVGHHFCLPVPVGALLSSGFVVFKGDNLSVALLDACIMLLVLLFILLLGVVISLLLLSWFSVRGFPRGIFRNCRSPSQGEGFFSSSSSSICNLFS